MTIETVICTCGRKVVGDTRLQLKLCATCENHESELNHWKSIYGAVLAAAKDYEIEIAEWRESFARVQEVAVKSTNEGVELKQRITNMIVVAKKQRDSSQSAIDCQHILSQSLLSHVRDWKHRYNRAKWFAVVLLITNLVSVAISILY